MAGEKFQPGLFSCQQLGFALFVPFRGYSISEFGFSANGPPLPDPLLHPMEEREQAFAFGGCGCQVAPPLLEQGGEPSAPRLFAPQTGRLGLAEG